VNKKLWNKNFTIITVGSIISMMGNAVSNFALGLVVYNHTSSTLLYSLFMILNTIPKILIPLIAGPFVDRYSRKKIIVTIDIIYGFLFLGFSYIIYIGFFDYSFYIMFSMILGTLDSFYHVAYESLYPEYIGEGNFSKAYSISSLLYPIANTIMVPIAGFVYEWIGVFPLFLFNAITFFLTQGLERFLDADKCHIKSGLEEVRKKSSVFWSDLKEGFQYIKQEPGLMGITSYFFVTMMAMASSQTLLLPYFTNLDQVSRYSIFMSIVTLGRIIGGMLHYKYKYPTQYKFNIALFVYIAISILEGSVLYLTYPLMGVCYLFSGMLSVTSYNIRISGTQSYLEPDKRGRFNGMFMMVTMLGSMIGQFTSGILGDLFPIPYVISGFMVMNMVGALSIMLKNRTAVKKIYNQNL
jgi:MFS family permease